MTIIIAYVNKVVTIDQGKIYVVENGKFGTELSELPKEQFKKVIGKKGL
ncbi:hypothetical protein ACQKEY_22595 [Lysinibacillus fusiformis]|nr:MULTISPECIES: hypothetical protein [Lysinibacillus]MED4077647.1 hypothetical protein [Lysinibacillus fusiformis]